MFPDPREETCIHFVPAIGRSLGLCGLREYCPNMAVNTAFVRKLPCKNQKYETRDRSRSLIRYAAAERVQINADGE